MDWYNSTYEWLSLYAQELHSYAHTVNTANIRFPSDLVFLDPGEIDLALKEKQDRLSLAACMQLFSAFEGTLKFDSSKRVRKRRVGKRIKKLINNMKKQNKEFKDISVKDLLDCWCDEYSMDKKSSAMLRGLFAYRHWLAHGRYWHELQLPIRKSAITPELLHAEMRKCFNEFARYETDFVW